MTPAALFTPTGILGILLAAVAIYAAAITHFFRETTDAYSNYRAAVELAQKQAKDEAEAEAERLAVEQERIHANTAAGWAAAVDYHRRNPRTVRVLPPAACGVSQAGAVPTAASNDDGLPAGEHRPAADRAIAVEECEARLNGSLIDAEWIVGIKQWIIDQHEASK